LLAMAIALAVPEYKHKLHAAVRETQQGEREHTTQRIRGTHHGLKPNSRRPSSLGCAPPGSDCTTHTT
jgi:hypothetical protein